MSSKEINIIGGGCAAFSLARFNNLLPQYKFNLFLKDQHQPINDHYWGFWKFKENQEAYDNSYCSWNNWAMRGTLCLVEICLVVINDEFMHFVGLIYFSIEPS